mgnify:CR=1 FL=1
MVLLNVGNHANNNDPPDVVDEQTNDVAAAIHNIADNNDQGINVDTAPVRNTADSRDNNEQLNDAVNNDCREVADGQLIEAVVGNGNIETHYAAIGNDGTTFTINYLNDQLELRDERIRELEKDITKDAITNKQFEKLIEVRASEGHASGPAFCRADGSIAPMAEYDDVLHNF